MTQPDASREKTPVVMFDDGAKVEHPAAKKPADYYQEYFGAPVPSEDPRQRASNK